MRKIEYPEDKTSLMADYQAIFSESLQDMQEKWVPIRDYLRRLKGDSKDSSRLYPDKVMGVILADYELLVDIFVDYHQLKKRPDFDKEKHDELKLLFHYSGVEENDIPIFQPKIADFFMHHQKEMKIAVCYYCELSYINSYGLSESYKDFGKFLKHANSHEIEKYVTSENGKKLSSKTYKKILELQNEEGVTEDNIEERFNKLDWRWNKGKKKSEQIMKHLYNHFDLDHFLPKSECPLVGLSLMNFVPSCSVCNEKLKGSDVLGGKNESEWRRVLKKVSPISSGFDFERVSKIRLDDHGHGWLRAQDHPEDYTLEFKSTDIDYQSEIIDEFHLDERYNYHKCEALRWHDLMNDYPPSRIKEIAEVLSGYKTEDQLRNDIFQNDYFEDNVRCFDKLRRDILGI